MRCPFCRGRGTQTLHGAAITGEEMAELGHDFQEDYMAGVYDHKCDFCGGSGKTTQDDFDFYHEVEAERRMGA